MNVLTGASQTSPSLERDGSGAGTLPRSHCGPECPGPRASPSLSRRHVGSGLVSRPHCGCGTSHRGVPSGCQRARHPRALSSGACQGPTGGLLAEGRPPGRERAHPRAPSAWPEAAGVHPLGVTGVQGSRLGVSGFLICFPVRPGCPAAEQVCCGTPVSGLPGEPPWAVCPAAAPGLGVSRAGTASRHLWGRLPLGSGPAPAPEGLACAVLPRALLSACFLQRSPWAGAEPPGCGCSCPGGTFCRDPLRQDFWVGLPMRLRGHTVPATRLQD